MSGIFSMTLTLTLTRRQFHQLLQFQQFQHTVILILLYIGTVKDLIDNPQKYNIDVIYLLLHLKLITELVN